MMRKPRRLPVRRETLRVLDDVALRRVAGGESQDVCTQALPLPVLESQDACTQLPKK